MIIEAATGATVATVDVATGAAVEVKVDEVVVVVVVVLVDGATNAYTIGAASIAKVPTVSGAV